MISPRHLEGIAREIHEQTGVTPPIDAFELADLCGFTCRPWGRGGGKIDLVRKEIRFPVKSRAVHQHGTVAHELGHFAIGRGGEDDRDEEAAQYMAGALMLPRDQLLADLRATDWDLDELRRIHLNTSAQMIVVRITQVSEATASVWDAGKMHRAYGGHDTSGDAELVGRVLETGEPVRGLISAWPVISPRTVGEGEFRRVIVVRRAA